jgi:hypothetical protein
MTSETFEKIMLDQMEICSKMLSRKAELYAHGDRLSNFKKAGNLSGETSVKACWGMMIKHIVALSDYIVSLENGKLYSKEEWQEKITDIINYLILMKALLEEIDLANLICGHGQYNSGHEQLCSGTNEQGIEGCEIQSPVSDKYKSAFDKRIRVLEELGSVGGSWKDNTKEDV